MMPYPVLDPWNEDYGNAEFELETIGDPVMNAEYQITIPMQIRNSAETLRELVRDKKAQYFVMVSCEETFMSETVRVDDNDFVILDGREYAEEALLRPYLVAVDALDGFASPEHAEEWRLHKPEGFDVPRKGIMAVGEAIQVLFGVDTPESVIDLVPNADVQDGFFEIDLGDQRIKIILSVNDKSRVESIRMNRASNPAFRAMFAGLYLHAVAEALRHLGEYSDSRWARVMRRSLDNVGFGEKSDEEIADGALSHAQRLMKDPLGDFLDAMASGDDD